MIATDRFIYIHLHKSGGTFVNECLMRFFPKARQLGYHLPCRLIPQALRALPVLGFVRNPWSYYVSWYAFQSGRPNGGNLLFRCLSENGTLGFAGTVRNMLELGSGSPKLDELLEVLPDAYSTKGFNIPASALARIRKTGAGFYSFLYHYMYDGHAGKLHLGRTETLREDFLDFFTRFRIDIGDEAREFIGQAAARNPSTHADYASYYDPELRDLVGERDRTLIKAFDYAFGGLETAAS